MSGLFLRIQAYCLAKPDVFEDYPWGDTVWKTRAKGKIFCFGGQNSMTVKASLEDQSALIQLPGIAVAAYVGRHGWITVDLSEAQNELMAFDLIDNSYELVNAKPKPKPKGRSPG